MIQGKQRQTFNDGIVRIYSAANSAANGEYPLIRPDLKETLRYHERTVGFKRFFEAKRDNAEVRYVLRTPLRRNVAALDAAQPNDGVIYDILQVQYPEDVTPASMDLTLAVSRRKFEGSSP